MSEYPVHRPAGGGPGSWPAPGDPAATTMRPAGDVSAYVRQLLPWTPILVVFFLVLLLLGSIVFETMAEGTGFLLGIVTGLVGALGGAGVLVAKVYRSLAGTVVVASPTGVELRDQFGIEVRLRWNDVTEVGTVLNQQGPRRTARAPGPGGVRVSTPVLRTAGLKGWGERVVPPNAPANVRKVVADQPRDPNTGRELVAISFSAAGAPGRSNPLLAQARHYRPDLFG